MQFGIFFCSFNSMKPKEKILTAISHRILTYQKLIFAGLKHLVGQNYYDREKDYFNYIGETKQMNCQHKNISKLSSTKFYCTECGKTFNILPEEVTILSELLGVLLVGSLVYLLTKKKK